MKEMIVTIGLVVSVIVFLVSLVFFSWYSVALSGVSVVILATLETTLTLRRAP